MPMSTVYAGDPALKFRCNETRTFILIPNATDTFPTKIPVRSYHARGHGWQYTEVHPYSRLEYYGLKQGYIWTVRGITNSTHYMTEIQNGICYFKNSM